MLGSLLSQVPELKSFGARQLWARARLRGWVDTAACSPGCSLSHRFFSFILYSWLSLCNGTCCPPGCAASLDLKVAFNLDSSNVGPKQWVQVGRAPWWR